MSEQITFDAEEVRGLARKIQAVRDDTDPVPGRITDAAQTVADANQGFDSGARLVSLANDYESDITELGGRVVEQGEGILASADEHEAGDEASADAIGAIDPTA